jgi:S1-C subfamily serine protease
MDTPTAPVPGRWRRLRSGLRQSAPFAGGMLVAFIALLLYNLLFPGPRPLTTNQVNDAIAQAMASATPRPAYSELVYQTIRPSLVLIQTDTQGKGGSPEHSLGSGVIINDAGDVLTALHVVQEAGSIKLSFADGTESTAQVVARQPELDIAVLRPNQPPTKFVPAVLGNPQAMQVGDEAYVVGNPFGLYDSMSAGVISAFNRSFQPTQSDIKLEGLIQIDAAVNPGNSGGPLLNRDGQVIGIIEGVANPTEDTFFVGIAFAVPINTAAGVAGLPPY